MPCESVIPPSTTFNAYSKAAPKGMNKEIVITDAYPGTRWSRLSLLLVLGEPSGAYEGGDTTFFSGSEPSQARGSNCTASIRVPPGSALVFPQAPPPGVPTPMNWPLPAPVHSGSVVTSGAKIVLRSDIMFGM